MSGGILSGGILSRGDFVLDSSGKGQRVWETEVVKNIGSALIIARPQVVKVGKKMYL